MLDDMLELGVSKLRKTFTKFSETVDGVIGNTNQRVKTDPVLGTAMWEKFQQVRGIVPDDEAFDLVVKIASTSLAERISKERPNV